ncbi:hypothetical protein ABEX25_09585 [Paenibacillus thiaminolyticus]|uniref:hypothetical protein n=1 Tax=Paenibacillus thiaminolyticus TaxID=49283 RepID=UPI003D2AD34A
MLIRKANPDEASYLSGLAFRSKAENFYPHGSQTDWRHRIDGFTGTQADIAGD